MPCLWVTNWWTYHRFGFDASLAAWHPHCHWNINMQHIKQQNSCFKLQWILLDRPAIASFWTLASNSSRTFGFFWIKQQCHPHYHVLPTCNTSSSRTQHISRMASSVLRLATLPLNFYPSRNIIVAIRGLYNQPWHPRGVGLIERSHDKVRH